ncbi:AAA family ATPase, partial [uncultured Ruminococcus sp.]|uniref:AAA family ATPase n=1 Tax=uncultured Ruminococcus sp. TaxID=165186 RepID=UPI0025E7CDB5
MLSELYIENLAVIEKASIEFTGSLNAFTGETGAGKSILINGINAILGQRVTKDIVRTGADKAVISGLFTDIDGEVLGQLSEMGIECDEGQLFLTREIRSDGGSVARINQRAVNISLLRDVGALLVNIHGQHDNQILMAPERHIDILDSYADSEELIADYRSSFHELQDIAKRINKLNREKDIKEFRIAELQDIIAEIRALDITDADEEKQIAAELEISKNAVAISEAVYAVEMMISGDDETEGISESVSECSDKLDRFTDIMSELSPLYERLSSAAIELDDIARELGSLLDSLDVDPKRFDWLNQRSDDLRKICKKYGPELSDVMATLERSEEELAQLTGSEQSIKELAWHLIKEQLV